MITIDQLRRIMPLARARANLFITPLNDAMTEFGIDTLARQAAFLAQIAHESAELRYTLELASGAAYDTGPKAARLGNTPAADGDGQRYKGRGLIQVTGRANYIACSQALYGDARLLADPTILEAPEPASRSAGWFWSLKGLNVLADAGDFERITRLINGGLNGYDERLMYWARAKKEVGA
ncbi:MAG: glycoside hydrolase family 19 protein [Rhodocyclaceae bacterium]